MLDVVADFYVAVKLEMATAAGEPFVDFDHLASLRVVGRNAKARETANAREFFDQVNASRRNVLLS